ncbi:MAG: hypothetical protein BroJett040_10580 [Oligoflexia bacterium]|nr:MAG: hypothetical protein BroJett040_10580 [Oligoflexia bacterium]
MNSFEISSEELTFIRTHLKSPSLEVVLSSEFSSTSPDFRNKIQERVKTLNISSGSQKSISHTSLLGGFAYTREPLQIGFDLEVTDRVRPEIIQRMSTPAELAAAPGPAHLWCAKEAIFKALVGATQPQVISALEVGDWKREESQIETFCLVNLQKFKFSSGRGCILKKNQLTMGIFTLM